MRRPGLASACATPERLFYGHTASVAVPRSVACRTHHTSQILGTGTPAILGYSKYRRTFTQLSLGTGKREKNRRRNGNNCVQPGSSRTVLSSPTTNPGECYFRFARDSFACNTVFPFKPRSVQRGTRIAARAWRQNRTNVFQYKIF